MELKSYACMHAHIPTEGSDMLREE